MDIRNLIQATCTSIVREIEFRAESEEWRECAVKVRIVSAALMERLILADNQNSYAIVYRLEA